MKGETNNSLKVNLPVFIMFLIWQCKTVLDFKSNTERPIGGSPLFLVFGIQLRRYVFDLWVSQNEVVNSMQIKLLCVLYAYPICMYAFYSKKLWCCLIQGMFGCLRKETRRDLD